MGFAMSTQKEKKYSNCVVTPAQCRAARGLLDWSQDALSKECGMSRKTLTEFESGKNPRTLPRTIDEVRRVLEAAGIEFIPENGGGAGVRLRRKAARS